MRQFKLINAKGQEYSLMRRDAFFHDPVGFGFGTIPEVQRTGNSLLLIKADEEQPMPSGSITFAGYKQYDEFQEFINQGGIVLCYKPLNVWRYINVEISIEKDEITKNTHRLECPVQFTGTSFWYEKITAYRSVKLAGDGKRYGYTYPYTYIENRPGIIDVNNGSKKSYCKIHIFGPCTNPAFTISSNRERIADGRVLCSVPEGHKLVLDSSPATMEISEYTVNGDFVSDRYGDSDFSTDRLIQLPAGESRFSFTHEGLTTIKAFVEVKKRV